MARHKHADLIHAWAEGAEIEILSSTRGKWIDVTDGPNWSPLNLFRIKPEKKPDAVRYIATDLAAHFMTYNRPEHASRADIERGLIKVTVDGETGELINAEVIK